MKNLIKKLFPKDKHHHERGFNEKKNTLDGRKFISFTTTTSHGSSLMSRTCDHCKFCEGETVKSCNNNDAKDYFNYKDKEIMSLKFGEKHHRGYFCKFFKLAKKFKR